MKIIKLKRHQKGVSLFMSLVLLLILSLLAVTGMNSSILDSKIATNLRDRDLSFQAAETSLKRAEKYLQVTYPLPAFDGNNGLMILNASQDLTDTTIWSALSHAGGSDAALLHLATRPEYIIEKLPAIADSAGSLEAGLTVNETYFRVTAKAKGATGASTVMVQSIFKR